MNQLARIQNAGMPDASQMSTMLQMAEALYNSGLLPAHIKSPQAAFAVIQKGTELGIPPMHALSNIVVIQGKPTANAELMLALIYRDHGDDAVRFTKSTADLCEILYKRRSWRDYAHQTFTAADAKAAGLSGGNWAKYPAAMLRARCISAVARMAFPDTIGGMYTPEELDAAVVVDADGSVTYDARQSIEIPAEPPRQIAEATVVDGNVVTEDGEIVGQLQRVDDLRITDDISAQMDSILAQLCEIELRSDLAKVWPTITKAMQTDETWFARCTAEWERITGKRAPVRTQTELVTAK